MVADSLEQILFLLYFFLSLFFFPNYFLLKPRILLIKKYFMGPLSKSEIDNGSIVWLLRLDGRGR